MLARTYRVRRYLGNKAAILLVSAAPFGLVPTSMSAVLPAGANLEVRLSCATGSRFSHPGDLIRATIIAPVFEQGRLTIPQGATISGVIESVDRLGLGLKHRTATMKYSFDSIELADGRTFRIKARVLEVETAKERVSGNGTIGGIYPTANLSSPVSFAISALLIDPEIAVPVIGVKFLIARSPDPEIYFPAGTEMILEVTTGAAFADVSAASNAITPLPPAQLAGMRHLLDSLPREETDQGRDHPSDLLNILLLGSRDQIDRAFTAAGWNGEQRHSPLAFYRMYHCLVQRMGYSMAPMATLMLNGMAPDVAYQKSLDTFSKRHHIRIWKEGDSEAWVGAATEDIAYAVRNMRVTHATDPEIDNERAKVVNDLWFTGCVDAGSLVQRSPAASSEEKGVFAATDGKIAALRLNDCRNPRMAAPVFDRPAEPRPRMRIVQALDAVGNDIARSNPISLAYSAGKSFFGQPDPLSKEFKSPPDSSQQKAELSGAAARRAWKRASPLNMGPAADPWHDISQATPAQAHPEF